MDFSDAAELWTALGAVSPGDLSKTRVALHWAAQVAGAVGTTHGSAEPDFGHTNLEWHDGVLLGQPVGASGVRGGLRLADARLLLTSRAGKPRAEKALEGLLLSDGLEWLGRVLYGADGSLSDALARPEHDLPDHAVANEGTFPVFDGSHCKELGLWFANADAVLRQIDSPSATPVRCWPHHFDLATLIVIDDDTDAKSPRSVNVGMSPGDASYDQPYMYVTPWPKPVGPLPNLEGGGVWHTAGWTGAVLLGGAITETDQASAQFERVNAFLRSAINAAFGLLGEPPP